MGFPMMMAIINFLLGSGQKCAAVGKKGIKNLS